MYESLYFNLCTLDSRRLLTFPPQNPLLNFDSSINRVNSNDGPYGDGRARDIGIVYVTADGVPVGTYITQSQLFQDNCRYDRTTCPTFIFSSCSMNLNYIIDAFFKFFSKLL